MFAARSSNDQTKVTEDTSELMMGEDFENSTALMHNEVVNILLVKKQQNENQDNVGSGVFEKSLAYVQRFSKYNTTQKEAITKLRATLESWKLHEFEVASICNLNPGRPDEAKALIPSLARYKEDELEEIIEDVLENVV